MMTCIISNIREGFTISYYVISVCFTYLVSHYGFMRRSTLYDMLSSIFILKWTSKNKVILNIVVMFIE